ncbi:uncharacterized protein HfgLR_25110 (plasmid) [Haloferax gibbonsii]|uniref:Uncharacterized protein n=1 Tax=Haloferax gibbonsii TaxID=35746 RepID=A0A871BM64_HALGI|nr:uncharacterized protein HfgLR_25110 [Haloferax gibbonsii]
MAALPLTKGKPGEAHLFVVLDIVTGSSVFNITCWGHFRRVPFLLDSSLGHDIDFVRLDIIGSVADSLRWRVEYLERFDRNSRLTRLFQRLSHSRTLLSGISSDAEAEPSSAYA